MVSLPVGTVTFLFTDVEGSTRLWELFPQAMRAAVARHDHLLRLAAESSGGIVFKMVGDGICAAFPTAPDAVAAALAAQLALRAEPWGETGPLQARMALHTGAVEVQGGDYVGPCLNRLARLLSLGHGGQVLLSQATSELVRDALPNGVTLRDLGEQRLRDLTRPEPVLQLLHPDLTATFPTLRSLDAYPNNLPLQLTGFVGREREMAEVERLLGTSRLLTLTGTGGCGKTRLALQVAADLLEEYPDGVWFVDLAPLSDSELVAQAVAFTLGLRDVPGEPILSTLRNYLKARHVLLVLDNCEHLLDACATLADALLRSCPKVLLLTTSREALGISGETAYRVPSLSLPDPRQLPPLASMSQYEAVRLFVERAVAVQPSFAVNDQNAPAVAKVCWRLDGMPLAIELAAARVRGLGVEQLAARLDDRFRLLTGGSRTALRRQQTLRAAIDWSHDLLPEADKALLCRLAVFAGGWTLEAAEAVCAGGVVESGEVIDLLLRLVDRSLVVADTERYPVRYRLLETIRQYAGEKLFESGDSASVRDRHLEWYLALAERAASHMRSGDDQLTWLERAEQEHDNLRAVLVWSLARDEDAGTALRLAASVGEFWPLTETRERLGPVLARSGGEPAARLEALWLVAIAESLAGQWHRARELREGALALARELGDRRLIARALTSLSHVASDRGDYAEARPLREEALGIAREVADRGITAWVLLHLSMLLYLQGDYAASRPLAEEGLAISRDLADSTSASLQLLILGNLVLGEGDLRLARALAEESVTLGKKAESAVAVSFGLGLLGDVARAEADYALAEALHRDSLATFQQLTVGGDGLRTTYSALRLAGIWVVRGRARQAARLYGAVHGWLGLMGILVPWLPPRGYLQDETDAREALGEEAFGQAWAEGKAMTLVEAVEYALQDET